MKDPSFLPPLKPLSMHPFTLVSHSFLSFLNAQEYFLPWATSGQNWKGLRSTLIQTTFCQHTLIRHREGKRNQKTNQYNIKYKHLQSQSSHIQISICQHENKISNIQDNILQSEPKTSYKSPEKFNSTETQKEKYVRLVIIYSPRSRL